MNHRLPSVEVIARWLQDELGVMLEMSAREIDRQAQFQSYGLDSARAVALTARLGAWLGRSLPATLAWQHPSIDRMARFLAQAPEAGERVRLGAIAASEPIAIVGMGCRFPGDADSPQAFWELLRTGRDAVTEIPPERWDVRQYTDHDPSTPGKSITHRAGTVGDRIETFDPQFFQISPREATEMDPQQRLLLEVAWEALEDAGIAADTLRDTSTAVMIGAMWSDFGTFRHAPEQTTIHSLSGAALDVLAGRLSYQLGLHGPSMVVNTACSSSLVALHLACQSLRDGESSLALVGGVNLLLSPETMVAVSKFGALSPDGVCRAFGAGANGFVRSEGAGVVVLKPYRRALADGDRIYCLVRGSAVNNDGASNGLTAPNPAAQELVLRDACRRAGVAPEAVSYVEAHGTGTPLGDPIEATALGAVYGAARPETRPLRIGSVKSNLGHLEAAAGIAGLMKVALALHHGELPASLHSTELNPLIAWDDLRLRVQHHLEPWPKSDGEHDGGALAGVSSFGWSGTNAHVLLEGTITDHPEEARAPALAPPRSRGGKLAFVCSPHGAQWVGMGRALLRSELAFREAFIRCDRSFRRVAGWSLLDALFAERPSSHDVAQPLLFAMHVALAAQWRHWGLVPDAVVGHSLGEVSAAHIAGVLELDDATRVIYEYSRLPSASGQRGAMAVVERSANELAALLPRDRSVVCGAFNAPRSTVLSGEPEALAAIVADLRREGVRCATIDVDVAGHSTMMAPYLEPLERALAGVRPRSSKTRLYSTVTGMCAAGPELDGAYFAKNLGSPVLFAQAIGAMLEDGVDAFVELSASPLLGYAIAETARDRGRDPLIQSSLERGREVPALYAARTRLSAAGFSPARHEIDPSTASLTDRDRPAHVLVLSGRTEEALEAQAARYAASFTANGKMSIADACHAAATARTHFEHRLALVATTTTDAAAQLEAFSAGSESAELLRGRVVGRVGPKVAFLFTGQGSQYVGMGRELYATQPVFREALARCAALADPHLERPLLDVLHGADGTAGLIDKTGYTQVALFAVEYALSVLWRSWGVVPTAVLGHSVGEYVAACVAGVFSLEDGIRLIATRGRLMQSLPEGGAMASVEAPIERVRAAIDRCSSEGVEIAARNSPKQVVLSGSRQAVRSVCEALQAEGVKTRPLEVSHAFHSALMEPMLDELERAFETVKLSPPALPMVTNLRGEVATDDVTTPAYWRRQAREAVEFSRGIETLVALGVDTFLELGPQPVLIGLGAASVPEGTGSWLGSLRKGRPEWPVMLESLARLFVAGCPVDWRAFDEPYPRTKVSLPTYAFQRTRHWIGAKPRSRGPGHADVHPLLGEPWSSSVDDGTRYWQNELHSGGALAYLSDHRVAEAAVLPAAAHVEIALAAAREVYGDADVMVEQMVLGHALTLPERETCTVQVATTSDESGLTFQLSSRQADGWRRHSTARLRRAGAGRPAAEPLESIRARCQLSERDGATFYAAVEAERAFPYGPAFRGLEKVWLGEGEALAHAVLTEAAGDDTGYALHPAFLDSAFQVVLAILPQFVEHGLMMPIEVQRVRVYEPIGTQVWSHGRIRGERGAATVACDVRLLDASGNVLAEFEGIVFTRAPDGAFRHAETHPSRGELPLYGLEWRPDSGPRAKSPDEGLGRWLVLADSEANGLALCEGIASAGGVSTSHTIDLSDRAAAEKLVASTGPLAGVVCWWKSDERQRNPAEEAERRAVAALHLVQALVAAPKEQQPRRLLWVTEHAQSVRPNERVSVEGAPLWGLGRTVMQEHRELGCHLIDVDAGASASESVLREIVHPDEERQIAWRSDVRHVARLVRSAAHAATARELTGTVLVTGGLGALGLLVSRWLVEARGVRNLVLVGRTAPTGERLLAVDALRAAGARVTVAQADVADPVQLGAVIAAIPEEAPLRGVVHAAGALDEGALTAQSAESWAPVLAPKLRGAWALHEATREVPLDFFLLFSSSSALFGWAGHGGYAAANAFLDALAHQRHADGLPALSVNWGVWAAGGMIDRVAEEDIAKVERIGLLPLTGAQGIQLLARAVERPEAQLAGIHVDFATMRQAMGHHVPPMWQMLVRREPERAEKRQQPAPSAWADRMATLAPEARAAELEVAVRAVVLRVLALPASSDVPRDLALRELGLDSLMAVELRDRLATQLGQPLPATLAFDYPTIRRMAEFLGRKLVPVETTARATAPNVRRTTTDEPIAIVGIGCRYPGGVNDLESFWGLLADGVDAIGEMPWKRWGGGDDLYDPDPNAAGKVSTRNGGFLDDVARFDARFFGIATREALRMDPQQRALLEVTTEALEHAGIRTEDLEGSQTGVFLGLMFNDYSALTVDLEQFDGYVTTGSSGSVAAGRVSYLLGLKGPSLAVDTGCSSSLVSLHLACQSLRDGDCDRALAAGVTLLSTPQWLVESSRLRIQSGDGRCKSFDAAADGVGWGEGCAVLVLKRLSDATRDGDRIWGVVRGSAVNQDGRSNGLTAPNGPSQEEVIRRALAQARAQTTDVGYVEAHGTGTPLGDTVELQALAAVFGDGRTKDAPLVVGSVKSNFGHTGAAAGIGGVIKALLSLKHEVIPRTLHFRNPNPAIPWNDVAITVADQPIAWRANGRPRVAGVSSFGIGGTNAHVLISEAPAARPQVDHSTEEPDVVVPVSGKDVAALRSQCLRYARYLETHDDALRDVMHTAFARRTHHPHRVAVLGRSREDLAAKLTAFGEEKTDVAAPKSGRRVAFVFPGAGGQWEGMGRELWTTEPTFRQAVEECDRVMQRWLEWSVAEVLRGEGPNAALSTSDVIQPALFAFQIGLAALLRAWGIKPAAVVGHSMGELAAAHVAGALSLEDAARIICVRSKVAMTARGLGRMAAVELSEDEARMELQGYAGRVAIGAVNGPRSIVLSGERAAIEEVCAKLEARGVFTRWIKVDYASHGPQMDPLRGELLTKLGHVEARSPAVPLYSTVTATRCRSEETLDADYWARNLCEPVRFWSALEKLRDDRYDVFLEINAHPILLPAIEEGLGSRDATATLALACLRRQEGARARLLEAIAALYVAGADVDWSRVAPAGRLVPLPAYPFQGERLWPEAPSKTMRRSAGAGGHALLGPTVALATGGVYVWESEIDLDALRYFADHCVEDAVIFPGAGYIEMALAGAREVYGDVPFALEDVAFERALSLVPGQPRIVQLAAHAEGEAMRFTFASRASGEPWIHHATGRMVRVSGADVASAKAKSEAPATVLARCAAKVAGGDYYAHVASRGLVYGPAFQGITAVWSGTDEVLTELQLPPAAGGAGAYGVHPALLDAALHSAAALLSPGNEVVLPVAVRRVRILRRGVTTGFSHVRASTLRVSSGSGWTFDVQLLDSAGSVAVEVEGLHLARVAAQRPVRNEWLLGTTWRAAALGARGAASLAGQRWLVLAGAAGVGAAVAARLEGAGAHVLCLPPETGVSAVRAAFADGDWAGVVHCWSADEPAEVGPDGGLGAATRDGEAALAIVQEVASRGARTAPRLWLVTRGAQAVEQAVDQAGVAAPAGAVLSGLGRTIAQEHPELRCTRVDLDARTSEDIAGAALAAEVLADDPEEEVAYRGGVRWVARLARGTRLTPAESAPVIRADAAYLVTGGLGGLGLALAGWLVGAGARHLVLVGRRGVTTATQRAALSALEADGARVLVVQADVAEYAEVERLLTLVEAELPPLRGVIHAAAVNEPGMLVQQDGASFARSLRAKAVGAWHLHTLTSGRSLDFFVFYSSVASLVGSPGQGNYVAANSYVDALSHHRRALGQVALSINWGSFGDVGSAAETNRDNRLANRGLHSLTVEQGHAALEWALGTSAAQVGVVPMDVRQYLEFYPQLAGSSLWSELVAGARGSDADSVSRTVRAELADASPAARRDILERVVRTSAATVLRMDPAELPFDEPFMSLGVDSLMGLELRSRLETALGLRFSGTLIWTYPTGTKLVDYLLERIAEFVPPALPESQSTSSNVTAEDLERLSVAEKEALLERTLAELEDSPSD